MTDERLIEIAEKPEGLTLIEGDVIEEELRNRIEKLDAARTPLRIWREECRRNGEPVVLDGGKTEKMKTTRSKTGKMPIVLCEAVDEAHWKFSV